ncbi:hypothetical protein WD019_07770 [Fictibacillus sp. Mic-4]|uniref:hypothetical protein n=1 Tax=Fictibacillus sp. Mic-4 TaxID=3132826 RepID=UPI003CFA7244
MTFSAFDLADNASVLTDWVPDLADNASVLTDWASDLADCAKKVMTTLYNA